eukprot:m.112515 g.112515  ORF g.112515 m.112515 type:complete len:776 (+) comp14090_c0_seq3:191-2518(+)
MTSRQCAVIFLIIACNHVMVAADKNMYACQTARTKSKEFCNASLSYESRVQALLSELTQDEKLSLMGAHGKDTCAFLDGGVARLDIPQYTWCTETNTGVSTECIKEGKCVTTFPSPALLAASFNRTLWRAKGRVQGLEQRAYFNLGATRATGSGIPGPPIGLNGWGPNINVVRDPRYGRNSELPSEDPFLNGEYAIHVVHGMQNGSDPKWPLLIHATLKHYTAYSVETNRFGFSGNVSTYDLFDSFLPQYEAGFTRGQAGGAMCSYMSMNGIPSCANEFILNHMVRNEWGMKNALIVTDCLACASMYLHNHYAKDVATAAAAAINSGVDLNTGTPFYQDGGLAQAIGNHTVTWNTVDTALSRSLLWRFRLGLFDDPSNQSYSKSGLESINTTSSQSLVQEGAAQGFILLKNEEALPIKKGSNVAVVGPHANSTIQLLSDYYGDQVCFGPPDPGSNIRSNGHCIPTIGQSVTNSNAGGTTKVFAGVGVTTNLTKAAEDAAMDAVAWAESVVLCVGIDHSIEHEGIDRDDIVLPQVQLVFAKKVLALTRQNNIKLTLVLVNGGAIAIDDLMGADAIIEAFYPNSAGSVALGKAIFGDSNRWGKLPITIYPQNYANELTIEQMRMQADPSTNYPGRGYRYYTGKALFPFGSGLSYTHFSTECSHKENTTSCNVTNIGDMDGDEVVFLFHIPPKQQQQQQAIRRLIDFQRVSIGKGETVSVEFISEDTQFKVVSNDMSWNNRRQQENRYTLTPGEHTLMVQTTDNTHNFSVLFDISSLI